jgi:hypothetical protein
MSERPAPPTAAGRSNVVPITSRLATAERLDDASAAAVAQSERLSIAPDPFAMPVAPTPAPVPAVAVQAPTRDSFVGAPPSLQPPPVIVQKQPTNFLGIGMVGAFLAFGGVAAWALFIKPPPVAPPPQVIVQQVPVPQQQQAPQTNADPGGPAPQDTPSPGASSGGKTASRGASANAGAKDAGAAPDLHGLLGGLGTGPNVGGPNGNLAAGGPALTADQIQSVVSSRSLGVKRTCWERGGSGASAANETLTLTIAGTGRVTNASSAGSDPVTGTCLEKEVRNWQFPATGSTSTVNIPFHFVRQ